MRGPVALWRRVCGRAPSRAIAARAPLRHALSARARRRTAPSRRARRGRRGRRCHPVGSAGAVRAPRERAADASTPASTPVRQAAVARAPLGLSRSAVRSSVAAREEAPLSPPLPPLPDFSSP
ncbi:hypothetical protein OAO87_01005 [bacterium]|nr:hypothetical protein [bacterium]